MAIASCQQRFLASIPLTCAEKQHRNLRPSQLLNCRASVGKNTVEEPSSREKMRLAKLALAAVAAGVLTLGSVGDAVAAKSGGRIGGQAFRSSAPKFSGPRINNSRTNIYVNPPVAPPLVGGYGFGVPFYGGGWGWSPFTFFAPGPSVAVGVGGGFEIFVAFLMLGVFTTVIRRFTRGRRLCPLGSSGLIWIEALKLRIQYECSKVAFETAFGRDFICYKGTNVETIIEGKISLIDNLIALQ